MAGPNPMLHLTGGTSRLYNLTGFPAPPLLSFIVPSLRHRHRRSPFRASSHTATSPTELTAVTFFPSVDRSTARRPSLCPSRAASSFVPEMR
jgi:hypothetical protein